MRLPFLRDATGSFLRARFFPQCCARVHVEARPPAANDRDQAKRAVASMSASSYASRTQHWEKNRAQTRASDAAVRRRPLLPSETPARLLRSWNGSCTDSGLTAHRATASSARRFAVGRLCRLPACWATSRSKTGSNPNGIRLRVRLRSPGTCPPKREDAGRSGSRRRTIRLRCCRQAPAWF